MPIATLTIDIVAQLAKLRGDMDNASRIVDSGARKMSLSLNAVTAAAKGVAAGLTAVVGAGTVIVGFVNKVNEGVLAIKDLSEATGASYESISQLDNIARRAGGSLADASGVLIKFNNVLKEAGNSKDVAAIFKALNLNVEELKRLDPVQAMRATAMALDEWADNGYRARVEQELFGRAIAQSAPLFRELVEQQGVAATVTREQVEEADRLNKELARLRVFAEDGARAVANVLVPALNKLFEAGREQGVLGFLKELRQTIAGAAPQDSDVQAFRKASDDIAFSIVKLMRAVNESRPGTPQQAGAVAELKAKVEELKALRAEYFKLTDVQGGRGKIVPAIAKPSLILPETPDLKKPPAGARDEKPGDASFKFDDVTQRALDRLSNSDPQKIAALRLELQALLEIKAGGGGVAVDEAIRAVRKEIDDLDPAVQAAAENQARLNELMSATPSAQAARDTRDLALAMQALATETDPEKLFQLNEAVEDLLKRLSGADKEIKPAVDAISEFTKQAQRNIQDAFGDTLVEAMKGNFDGIGDLWLQLLQRMAAELLAAKFNELIKEAFDQTGSGGLGDLLGGIGAAIGGLFGGGRAAGGPMEAGKFYLVGENGPEIARGPGYVYPREAARSLPGAGGSTSYSPTVILQGDVGPATVNLVERMLARERARWSRQNYALGTR